MKKLINYTVIGLVSVSVGYGMYPILHDKGQPNVQSVTIGNSANHTIIKRTSIPKASGTEQGITLVIPQKSVEQEMEVQENTTTIIEVAKVDLEQSKLDVKSAKELNDWSALHKETIEQIISENVPTTLADAMTEMIAIDNNFLYNPEVLQDTQSDENWAFIMEQDLRSLINQNPESASFTLLGLTCKQLTCEILGVENTSGAWRNIYFSLLQTVPSIQLPNGNGGERNVNFSEDNISYIYYQLKFKPNNEN